MCQNDDLGACGRAYFFVRHILPLFKTIVKILVSAPFFQRLSICILGRCLFKQMANLLIIFTFFYGVRGPSIAEIHHCGFYARGSWPAGSNRLIFAGVGGGCVVLKYRKNYAIRPYGLFCFVLLLFSSILVNILTLLR